MEWIPVLALILFAAWYLRRQTMLIQSGFEKETAALRSDFELLRAEGIPAPPPNGFNINRRLDAQRRLRSGQSLDAIATATGWAAPELSLLQKIEKLTA